MAKRVLVPIAKGCEEIEAVTLIDVLRRAGAEVTVASVEPLPLVTASRGVRLMADCLIDDCRKQTFDLIVLPGGMPGAERLRDCELLIAMLQEQKRSQRYYGAICAAPAVVFETHGLLESCRATAHPDFVDALSNQSSAASRVVEDGHCITSRGPGTALEFALHLVELLYGHEKAQAVAKPMVI